MKVMRSSGSAGRILTLGVLAAPHAAWLVASITLLALPRAAQPHSPSKIPRAAATPAALDGAREAARTLSVELHALEVRQPSDLATAFSALAAWRAGAVLALSDAVFGSELAQFAKLAAKNRLPAMYSRREFAEAGGLLAYGPNFSDAYRRAAAYVDKILKGARPADLPVEQPTKFELVVNLRTAKALGLTITGARGSGPRVTGSGLPRADHCAPLPSWAAEAGGEVKAVRAADRDPLRERACG